MSEADFKRLIRNELPVETYLELACSYVDMGRRQDAARVLQLAPTSAEVLYWLAFLQSDADILKQALEASPEFVFPFRPESIAAFQWASRQAAAWQPRYFLALVHWANGDTGPAQRLLSECGDEPEFAPFFAARAQLSPATAEANLGRAAALSPGQWRYGSMRMKRQIENGEAGKALAIGANYRQRFPQNDAIALLNVKALMLAQDYQGAAELLEHLDLLPAEGTTEARAMHHEAHLLLAAKCVASREWSAAEKHLDRGRSWPENLGAGKPYPEFLDESVENWLAYRSSLGRGDSTNSSRLLNQIVNQPTRRQNDASCIVLALALRDSGKGEDARKLMEEWTIWKKNSALGQWAMEMLENRPSALPSGTRDLRLRALAISSGN